MRLQVGKGKRQQMPLPLVLLDAQEESEMFHSQRKHFQGPVFNGNNLIKKFIQSLSWRWALELTRFSNRGVLMTEGPTLLTLILSFAHSHARCLVSWFIAPFSNANQWQSKSRFKTSENNWFYGFTFTCWIKTQSFINQNSTDGGNEHYASCCWSFQQRMS